MTEANRDEQPAGEQLLFLSDQGMFEIDAAEADAQAEALKRSIIEADRVAGGRNEPIETLWRILRDSRSPEYLRVTVRSAAQRVLDACVFDAEAHTSAEVMRRLSTFVFTARHVVQNVDALDLGEGRNWRGEPLPPTTAG